MGVDGEWGNAPVVQLASSEGVGQQDVRGGPEFHSDPDDKNAALHLRLNVRLQVQHV